MQCTILGSFLATPGSSTASAGSPTQPHARRLRLTAMGNVLKIASSVQLGLLAIASCQQAWLHLTAEGSGIAGETILGPTSPPVRAGEVRPPGHVPMWGIVTRSGWPGVAAVVHAGAAGRFRVPLPPGLYTLHVLRSPWHPAWPSLMQSATAVRVQAHAYTPVKVFFDNGIA